MAVGGCPTESRGPEKRRSVKLVGCAVNEVAISGYFLLERNQLLLRGFIQVSGNGPMNTRADV